MELSVLLQAQFHYDGRWLDALSARHRVPEDDQRNFMLQEPQENWSFVTEASLRLESVSCQQQLQRLPDLPESRHRPLSHGR